MSSESEATCVFCRIVRGELTPGVLAFCDGQTAVFPSRHQQPGNLGHMLVVPARHIAHIYDVGDDLSGPLMTTVARVAETVKAVFSADGVSVRQNNEPHGGQDVFHLHFHVIPRFAGDAFSFGDGRFPSGAMEVPLEERVEQGRRVREALQRFAETRIPVLPRWNVAPYLVVDDVVATANYYRDKLGFEYDRIWNDPPSFCIVWRNGVCIMLAQLEQTGVMRPNHVVDPEGGAWDAYIWIDNADGLYAEFKAKGVKITRAVVDRPYGCRDFDVEDCNGYRLCFGQAI